VDCVTDRRRDDVDGTHNPNGRCCVVALRNVVRVSFAEHGGTGVCTFCGAHFVHGAVWVHTLTGVHVNVGHTCADKYDMLASMKDFDARRTAMLRNHAARLLAAKRSAARDAFLAERPALAADLATDHDIIRDIADRLYQWGTLSQPQMDLVAKIAAECRAPKPEPERLAHAPEGRTVVRGRVVSLKLQDTAYGSTWRMTVKVTTDDGNYLVWGTCPSSILDVFYKAYDGAIVDKAKGAVVEFAGALTRSDKSHFAFCKRPTKATVVSLGTPADVKPARAGDGVDPFATFDGAVDDFV
jgi:hypothetical protein